MAELPEVREAIDMFKVWSKGKLHWNGQSKNANKMAKILPLFQEFVRDHADFWRKHYGYSNRGAKPGQLSPIYPIFRDEILPKALKEIISEMAARLGVSQEVVVHLTSVTYVMKHTKRMNGQPTPRAIYGWVRVKP